MNTKEKMNLSMSKKFIQNSKGCRLKGMNPLHKSKLKVFFLTNCILINDELCIGVKSNYVWLITHSTSRPNVS